MNPRARLQGFTLIEAIIAIVLLALIATYAAPALLRAQTINNVLAGQAGAITVLGFLTDRLSDGDNRYAPVGTNTYVWQYGELKEPFAGNTGSDYANPAIYRTVIRSLGNTTVTTGPEGTVLKNYALTVCWKTVTDAGEECLDRTVVGPAD